MKNRLFKLFAFALAMMMLIVSIPRPVSATMGCMHDRLEFLGYTYEYEGSSAVDHTVYTRATNLCLDCGVIMGAIVGATVEAHTFGTVEYTGNHYHSRIFHIYETVATCKTCRYVKYGEVSYPCSGDGTNCPIFKG